MKKLVSFIVVILVCSQLFAGFENKDFGGKSLALAGSYTALANSGWTIFSNPAGLATISAIETGLFYQEPFGLSELKNISLMGVVPFSFGTIGVGVVQHGFELYKEFSITAAFSHQITDEFFAGYTFNFHQVSIKNYGQAASWSLDAGLLYFPVEWMTLGFSATNLTQSSIGKAKEMVPIVLRSGLNINILRDLHFTAEIYKQTGYALDQRMALDFLIHPNISIYTGIGSNPNNLAGGFSLYYEQFQLDYSIANHPDLGLTTGFTVSYSLNKDIVRSQYYRQDRSSLLEANSPTASNKSTTKVKTARDKKTVEITPIDLNKADIEDFQTLPGIGPSMASEILRVREQKGSFKMIDELLGIKGMSQAKFDKIKPYIFIDSE